MLGRVRLRVRVRVRLRVWVGARVGVRVRIRRGQGAPGRVEEVLVSTLVLELHEALVLLVATW